MARLPEGALMQRAAAGLAAAVARPARRRRTAGGCCCWSGPGDNGGDALYAGALLARRGCRRRGAAARPTASHEAGLAALRAAGGRVVDASPGRDAPDVVVDGIVGIGGRPGLRPERRGGARARVARRAGRRGRRARPGVDVDTGELDGAARARRRSPSPSAPTRSRHLVDPAAAACGVVHLVDIGLDLPDAGGRGAPGRRRRARCCRGPAPDAQKYTRGVVGVRAGSAALPRRRRARASPGAATGLCGMVRYVGDARRRPRSARAHPEVVVGEGRVQAWVVGSGRRRRRRPTRSPRRCADGVPLVVDADALAHVDAAARRPGGAHPARRRARRDARRRARRGRGRRRCAHARRAADEYDAVVLLKGRHTLVAAPGRPGAGHHHRRAVAGHRRRRRRARRARRRAARRRPRRRTTRRRSAPGCTAPRRPSPRAAARSRPATSRRRVAAVGRARLPSRA